MAHMLNYNETAGRHSFFSVKEKPWHELGVLLPERVNSAEAIKQALLDYEVRKVPVEGTIIGADGVKITQTLEDKFITYRADTNKMFGVVGGRYTIVQNKEAFSFFDAIVGEGEAIYETAGALYDGQSVFITAKLPDYIHVGDDLIEQYIFLLSTHDGSGSIQAAFTPTRIVCNNTLNAALGNLSNRVRIRHTQNANASLREAHKIMGVSNKLKNELETIFNSMAQTKISDSKLRAYLETVMAIPVPKGSNADDVKTASTRFTNKINFIFEYAKTSPTQISKTTKGTVFGAYNAVTGYFQNMKNYKTVDDKLDNILGGIDSNVQQKAFQLAFELI